MSHDQVLEDVAVEVPMNQSREGWTAATRQEREQLKALSVEIFGKSSRYQKLYEQKELITKRVVETLKGQDGAPDTTQEKDVPVLTDGGVKQYRVVYRNNAEVLDLLLQFKAKRDTFLAEMEKQKEEAKAREEAEAQAKKVQEDLAGSALT